MANVMQLPALPARTHVRSYVFGTSVDSKRCRLQQALPAEAEGPAREKTVKTQPDNVESSSRSGANAPGFGDGCREVQS